MTDTLPEISQALLRCNKCGFCMAGCPIYKVTGIEWTVARGRIALLQAAVNKDVALDELSEPIFNCLTCNCCVDHCPPAVMTDELILKARGELLRQKGQPWIQKFIFNRLLPDPHRLRRAAGLLGWLEARGLRSLGRKLGLTGIMGKARRAESIVPPIPSKRGISVDPAVTPRHPAHRVAYFAGCAAINITPQVAEAAIRVLHRHNTKVSVPDFVCCGMPASGYGDEAAALLMAKKNLDLMDGIAADAVITTCATCGSALKRYAALLKDDAAYASRAQAFAGKVKDISEFLVETGLNAEMGTLNHRVTYHDPCHLGRFQKVAGAPRQILRSIPGVEFVEMAEANMCCGAAGSYSMTHYDLSMKVLERKMNNVARTGAGLLVTCCPGCSMQLTHGIKEHGLGTKSMELVELLDLAYRRD